MSGDFGGIGWWQRWVRVMEGGLAPRADRCLWCDGRIERDASACCGLCARCHSAVPWIENAACAACGRAETCPDCVRREVSYVLANRAAVRYTPFMKEVLARYKYRGSERLEPLFAEMAAYAYSKLCAGWSDANVRTVLTFVPLSDRRLEERGFNQAEAMANGIYRRWGIPVIPLLVRLRHTEKQSYKSRRERLESLDRAFAVSEEGITALEALLHTGPVRLVLVDDVYTTGSTLQQCGEVLVTAFGVDRVEVYGVTWAR
jgi:competence protein ComFC